MPRKKPTSTNQLKAERQLKKAIKRGDAPPPDPLAKKSKRPRKGHSNRVAAVPGVPGASLNSQNAIETSRKLQSTFIRLPPRFLENTKMLANTLILPRPIPQEAALLNNSKTGGDNNGLVSQLTCPKRPKWRFDMSKTEVEKNEEGLHRKWIAQMDQFVEDWQKGPIESVDMNNTEDGEEEDEKLEKPLRMPRSPTYFERNLEVWRQLYVVNRCYTINC